MVISAEQQEKIVRVAPKRKTKTPVFEKAFLTPLREFGQTISGSIARKSKLRDGSTSGQGSTDCQVRIGRIIKFCLVPGLKIFLGPGLNFAGSGPVLGQGPNARSATNRFWYVDPCIRYRK